MRSTRRIGLGWSGSWRYSRPRHPDPRQTAKDPSAAEPQPTLPYVILSRRSAAKNLRLRGLRSFAVYAAQDDVAPKRRWTRRFQDVLVQNAHPEILRCAQDDGDDSRHCLR